MKPQLAEDADLDKVLFPCIAQPKIDGVRALNLNGTLTGRSMDPFPGTGITDYFSHPKFFGLDGEMILGNDMAADRLCSLTTGAMSKFKGVTEMADLHWYVFDYVASDLVNLPYGTRYSLLAQRVAQLNDRRLHLVPSINCYSRADLDRCIASFSEAGYEGTIIRNPSAIYKEGRATKKAQELWRVKPWGDFEIRVTGITEGQRNENEAKKNTLGRTERSSAQSGMVSNGQVGAIQGTLVRDLVVNGGSLTVVAGTAVTAGSGEMTVAEAKHYFENQDEIIGKFARIKTMVYGVKTLPRFPTFMSIRCKEDMASV